MTKCILSKSKSSPPSILSKNKQTNKQKLRKGCRPSCGFLYIFLKLKNKRQKHYNNSGSTFCRDYVVENRIDSDFVGKRIRCQLVKEGGNQTYCRRGAYAKQGGNGDLVQRKQPIWTGGRRQRMYVGNHKGRRDLVTGDTLNT